MQEIHVLGGGGRFFGGGDRRLRPHNNHNNQVWKCPRCDSLNTKFCYYNNYNLSQPRHFCKSCRRYWTKGGVLRNVPIGGGCRKTKRSKQKTNSGDSPRQHNSNARSSSSESSSLTAATATRATTTTSATTAVAEEGFAPSNTTLNSTVAYNYPDSRFLNVNPNNFDHQPIVNRSTTPDGQIFTTEIGSFMSMMAPSADMMGFNMDDIQTTSYERVQQGDQAPVEDNSGLQMDVEEFKMQNISAGLSNDSLATELDWGSGSGGDHGLFDLTAAVELAYWNQHQWTDDQSLNYLP